MTKSPLALANKSNYGAVTQGDSPDHVPTQTLAASGQNEELLGAGPEVVAWVVA